MKKIVYEDLFGAFVSGICFVNMIISFTKQQTSWGCYYMFLMIWMGFFSVLKNKER